MRWSGRADPELQKVYRSRLIHGAVFRRLVCPPPDEARAVPELAAAYVIGAEFGDQGRA